MQIRSYKCHTNDNIIVVYYYWVCHATKTHNIGGPYHLINQVGNRGSRVVEKHQAVCSSSFSGAKSSKNPMGSSATSPNLCHLRILGAEHRPDLTLSSSAELPETTRKKKNMFFFGWFSKFHFHVCYHKIHVGYMKNKLHFLNYTYSFKVRFIASSFL